MEAEKQLKFFQGCVAAAFAERDQAIMEAEKVKEKEDVISQKLSNYEKRLEELTSDLLDEKKANASLEISLKEQNNQNEIFRKVVNKFYEIRQDYIRKYEDASWESKCEYLLCDSAESWSFSPDEETSTSKYIRVLEEEVHTLRKNADNLQSKLSLGLEIENHLKKNVYDMKRKKILWQEATNRRVSELVHYHSLLKADIKHLLDDEHSHLKSMITSIQEKIGQFETSKVHNLESHLGHPTLDESDCRDVHVSTVVAPKLVCEGDGPKIPDQVTASNADVSEALTQVLQEKVAALLLLSQQDERHLLERNVNAALQKKVDELQRNLLQVTNEKVKSLMELAKLRRDYQLLQEKGEPEEKQGKLLARIGESTMLQEREGRMKNLLKKTYLKRWIGILDSRGEETSGHLNYEANANSRSTTHMDMVRMRIENATLRESLESMDHLISVVHRLRMSLLKVREAVNSDITVRNSSIGKDVNDIIMEVGLVKTALGSSLPISWSVETEDGRQQPGSNDDIEEEKIDFVTGAGLEMAEVLNLAAEILKDHISIKELEHR
ncbi:uncharacterized protein LOC124941897 isoform X2 [Impatiens glandulifera]|nr:uncharacterized protein LOC124941897 isoform X2 [Impatiens glandulifera]